MAPFHSDLEPQACVCATRGCGRYLQNDRRILCVTETEMSQGESAVSKIWTFQTILKWELLFYFLWPLCSSVQVKKKKKKLPLIRLLVPLPHCDWFSHTECINIDCQCASEAFSIGRGDWKGRERNLFTTKHMLNGSNFVALGMCGNETSAWGQKKVSEGY